jgi:hypothetical protein
MLTDLESTHQGLSFEVLHDMVSSISKFDLGYTIFDPDANHEGQSLSAFKTNQLSGRPHATFTPTLKLIHLKILEK